MPLGNFSGSGTSRLFRHVPLDSSHHRHSVLITCVCETCGDHGVYQLLDNLLIDVYPKRVPEFHPIGSVGRTDDPPNVICLATA